MSAYYVSFFKNLLSSDGHPFKCLQRRIDVTDAESAAQAAESASRLSKRSMDVLGSCMQIRSRSMRTRVNS
jgi:hypothetical protein